MRQVIHYTQYLEDGQLCAHGDRPHSTLWLAFMQGRVIGSYEAAWAALHTTTAEWQDFEFYRQLLLLEEGEASPEQVTEQIERIIESKGGRANGTPAVMQLAAAIAGVRIRAGQPARIDEAFAGLDDDNAEVRALKVLFAAQELYVNEDVFAGPRLTFLEIANDAAAQVNRPCFREGFAIPLALGYTLAGRGDEGLELVRHAGLPVERMLPFWRDKSALEAELLWHGLRVVRKL